MNIQQIPLNKLVPSIRNVRKTAPDLGIDALAKAPDHPANRTPGSRIIVSISPSAPPSLRMAGLSTGSGPTQDLNVGIKAIVDGGAPPPSIRSRSTSASPAQIQSNALPPTKTASKVPPPAPSMSSLRRPTTAPHPQLLLKQRFYRLGRFPHPDQSVELPFPLVVYNSSNTDMSEGNIQFDTDRKDEFSWTRNSNQRAEFNLTAWVVKKGIAKDVKQAEYVLLGICVVCVVLAIFLIARVVKNSNEPHIPPPMNPATAASNTTT